MDAISKSLLITLPNGKQAFTRGAIVFTNGGGISDFVIRMAQGFRGYTHCGIALGNGKMIAAWGAAGKVIEQDDLQQMTTEARLPWMLTANVEAAITMATRFIGNGYDFGGLLGIIGLPSFGAGPPSNFTCSSLVSYCYFREQHMNKPDRLVLPQDIWEVVK